MPSIKRCRSVAHSIGHHAISGLCYIHPHLGHFCLEFKLDSASVDLINPGSSEYAQDWPEPLKLASRALADTFSLLLDKEKIERNYIGYAEILFQFGKRRWPRSCVVRLRLIDGKSIEWALDEMGKRADVLSPNV